MKGRFYHFLSQFVSLLFLSDRRESLWSLQVGGWDRVAFMIYDFDSMLGTSEWLQPLFPRKSGVRFQSTHWICTDTNSGQTTTSWANWPWAEGKTGGDEVIASHYFTKNFIIWTNPMMRWFMLVYSFDIGFLQSLSLGSDFGADQRDNRSHRVESEALKPEAFKGRWYCFIVFYDVLWSFTSVTFQYISTHFTLGLGCTILAQHSCCPYWWLQRFLCLSFEVSHVFCLSPQDQVLTLFWSVLTIWTHRRLFRLASGVQKTEWRCWKRVAKMLGSQAWHRDSELMWERAVNLSCFLFNLCMYISLLICCACLLWLLFALPRTYSIESKARHSRSRWFASTGEVV